MKRLNILQILYGVVLLVIGLIACIFTSYPTAGAVFSVIFSILVIASGIESMTLRSEQHISSEKIMLQEMLILTSAVLGVITSILSFSARAYPPWIFSLIGGLSLIHPIFAAYFCFNKLRSSKLWQNDVSINDSAINQLIVKWWPIKRSIDCSFATRNRKSIRTSMVDAKLTASACTLPNHASSCFSLFLNFDNTTRGPTRVDPFMLFLFLLPVWNEQETRIFDVGQINCD